MSTFLQFTPSAQTPFTFQPTLGGTQCVVTITWNLFGQRYYVNVTDLSGNPLVTMAQVATGPSIQATFNWLNGVATATTLTPHNVPVGSLANVVVSQTGTGFDGSQQVLSTGASSLTYSLATTPNAVPSVNGSVSFALNLVGGYNLGFLYYHADTQQFEYG